MEFKRNTSNISDPGDPLDAIQLIKDEIEVLEAALAPYEIHYEVVQEEQTKVDANCDNPSTSDVHKIKLTVLPTILEGQKLAIEVVEDNKFVPIQFLPRLVLDFSFVLEPSKLGEYPMTAQPAYQIEGFFVKKASQISQQLEDRFEKGCPCLFDWFTIAKDELFADPENFDQYNQSFFSKKGDYDAVLTVQTGRELHALQEELYQTALLRAQAEPVRCMICFTQPDDLADLQFFKECCHAFCKSCVHMHCEHLIKIGQVDKLVCPAVEDLTNKPCKTQIKESDLRAVNIDEELIDKLTQYSINQAIDQMPDFGWCPFDGCESPAEIDEERNLGKCTECHLKFCTQCRSKWHPFKRCDVATKLLGKNAQDIKQAKNLVEERLNMLYIRNCSKPCPNCAFSIQKSEGCNKMMCNNCHTKFCWKCLKILCNVNPYLHFEESKECWDFETQQEELKEEQFAQAGIKDNDMTLASIFIDNTANCPQCLTLIVRGEDRVNLLLCDRCRLFFCYNCGKKLFQRKPNDLYESGFEQAKEHYMTAFCHFKAN